MARRQGQSGLRDRDDGTYAVGEDGAEIKDDNLSVRDILQHDFLQDGHFSELKQTEMLRERLALANEMRDYVGKFYSVNYIRKNILKQNDREIEKMDNEIKKEIDDGIIQSPMAQVTEEKK